MGIFAKHTGFTDQAYSKVEEWGDVSREIKSRWKAGYRLVNIEYTAAEWFLLFAKFDKPREEVFSNNEDIEDFRKTIRKYWKVGYSLIDLANGRY